MDDNYEQNLDTEYKRYLEIIRPYLCQLLDQDVIEVCDAWIQRLSNCKEQEKPLRNKYIFAMCYQLAKGILEEPFLKNPSSDDLHPLTDDGNTDDSLCELEYQIIDLENDTQVLYNINNNNNEINKNKMRSVSATGYLSSNGDFVTDTNNEIKSEKSHNSMTYNIPHVTHQQNIICYNCSTNISDFNNSEIQKGSYNFRIKNLVTKLREIKTQNYELRKELNGLKQEFRVRDELDNSRGEILKINNATSTYAISQDSTTTLKYKLQEVKESRNALLDKLSNFQNNLDNFNFIKNNEIDSLAAKHQLEIIEVKTSIREEVTAYYENKIDELKQTYEKSLKDFKSSNSKILSDKHIMIAEKDKIIISKENEIKQLNNLIEALKNAQCPMTKKNICNNGDTNSNDARNKAEELERRMNKMEKSKLKFAKSYDIKLINLQKEKHLIECSFNLELMRQRAHIINEMSNEHQTELDSALTKIENKYKGILANVQSAAVQRRIQEQMALESIIQAVCGGRNEGMYTNSAPATCPSQLRNKATRNQTRDCNGSCNARIPTVLQSDKVASIIVGNKSFGEESVVNDYCLDSEKLGELFEKMCIPQRDTGGDSAKK